MSPFVSESDEVERERNQHETRRLLYVAFTRARDRLYLSAALKDGTLQPGRGALSEVLPASVRALFPSAASAVDETISWTAASGQAFKWRVCRAEAARTIGV